MPKPRDSSTGKPRAGGVVSREDWVEHAYSVFITEGISALTVEGLAQRLSISKGSFYWHFKNRRDLVTAVLDQWERLATDAVIEASNASGPSGEHRLEALFRRLAAEDDARPSEQSLYSAGNEPAVQAVLERVTERRIGYVAELLGVCGFDKDEARRRAVLSLSILLGLRQLSVAAPACLPSGDRQGLWLSALQMALGADRFPPKSTGLGG
ncbi:TetR/AcrR family transcriptional regulator [Saxibacter everestensis]|uniref:TetR/AcrR family transcriptional regulator n=1 Tax=Saxibacter everestensis TaxID=2909229 RepID=A0ABY8QY63_9MICO|nr:TetR/AcrR family transcriptional regulator [Brevibacteriaceae bacterium ZFBP1038]